MADLQEILSSISEEDMAKIKNIADSLMNNSSQNPQPEKQNPPMQKSVPSFPFDEKMMGRLMSVMGQLNKQDNRTKLIMDLKPLLTVERQKKADDAVKFLQLMETLPLLKGMFGNE